MRMVRRGSRWLALLVSFFFVLQARTARSVPAPETPRLVDVAKSFDEAMRAIDAKEATRAIDELELLADRGALHPDISFNRGLAYLRRADSSLQKPGDLGQATAGFAESIALLPENPEAVLGQEQARLQIARRSARSPAPPVDTQPLAPRVLGLLSPAVLFYVASVGSSLLTLGLLAWTSRKRALQVSAKIGAGIGLLLLCSSALAAYGRHRWVTSTTPAIVVSERASLLDERGRPLGKGLFLTEGQAVDINLLRAGLAQVRTGTGDAWLLQSTLRILPDRR